MHPRPGGTYGKVNLDIPGTQPERDLLCGHIFPDHFAVASYLIVHQYKHIFPLFDYHTVSEVRSLYGLVIMSYRPASRSRLRFTSQW